MGSIFDDRQFLHGLPIKGQKVKYVNPTEFAFHTNVIENENLLELGKEYTVRSSDHIGRLFVLNSSSTYVCLEEFWDEDLDEYRHNQLSFNMHAFEWVKPEIDPSMLIGRDPRDCAMLHNTYRCGVTQNGKLWYEGDPMLYIEYEMLADISHSLRITKAYFQ